MQRLLCQSTAFVPGVCTEGGARMRTNKPLLRAELGPRIPSKASRTPPSTVRVVTAGLGQEQPRLRLKTPPSPGDASAARRAVPSPPDCTLAGRDSAYIPPRRPGWFPLRPRPNAPALARVRLLGPKGEPHSGTDSNPGSPVRPPALGPLTHAPSAWAHSPGAVAALPLSATLLAARPRDTRTAPARPGPG